VRPTPEPTAERRNGRTAEYMSSWMMLISKLGRCVVASWREKNASVKKGERYVSLDDVDLKLRLCVSRRICKSYGGIWDLREENTSVKKGESMSFWMMLLSASLREKKYFSEERREVCLCIMLILI
jgi:hypothetical protein